MLSIWPIHNYDTEAQAQYKELATIRIKVPTIIGLSHPNICTDFKNLT